MPNPELASEGLTPEFLSRLRDYVRKLTLARTEAYFVQDADPFSQEDPSLEEVEIILNFYDLRPCCVSVLAELASTGDERAEVSFERILGNTRRYMTDWRAKLGIPLRRLPLHLALSCERLERTLPTSERTKWFELLATLVEDILSYFNEFRPRVPALDNRSFGMGINHIALSAEGVWKAGEVLGRADWQKLAGEFIEHLVAYAHPDGYFEERTNDAREGGPSLAYSPLTAGASFSVQGWCGRLDQQFFARYAAFYRNMLNAELMPFPFADERANLLDHRAYRPYGRALHSLTPEGRGYLRLALDPATGATPYQKLALEDLARLYFELDQMQSGPGLIPEPFHPGTFRLHLPMGVLRAEGWTAGLSALRALNYQLGLGKYALDRQALVYLSHKRAGIILPGINSKDDPRWSTVRAGDDAYPVRTGDLRIKPNQLLARVYYRTFSVSVRWDVGEVARLSIASDSERLLTAQLILGAEPGQVLQINDGRKLSLRDQPLSLGGISTVATGTWRLHSGAPGRLIWPLIPHDPYHHAGAEPLETRRAIFAVNWRGRIHFTIRAQTRPSQHLSE